MRDIEFLRDVARNLDAGWKSIPSEQWLSRPLLPAQERFVALPHKYRLFSGGIGSGKTYLGCLLALSHMRPNENGLIVCPTYRMMSSVVEPMLLEMLNDADCSYTFKKSEEILIYNGSTTYFRNGERPDLFRGLSVAWAFVDEGAMLSEDVWKIILGRLRVGKGEAWICTSPRGFNWLYDVFVENESDEYGFVQSGTRENTFLPESYIKSLEMNYSDAFYEQELLGSFTAPSGLVFPELRRDIHLCDPFEIPESWETIGAIDFGYYHPFATVWAAFDEDRRMYVYAEYKQAQRLLKDHAEVLKNAGRVRYYLSDHDSQDRSELHHLGIRTYAAIKDVLPGLQSVKARLVVQGDGRPRLYVFKTCPELVKEFSTYCWHETRSLLSDAEKVVKLNDDLLDCARYISYFEEKKNRIAKGADVAAALGF